MIKQRVQKIELVPLENIILDPDNMNTHTDADIEDLAQLIKYQGFREPGIISNQTGFLKAGEGRYLAAKKLGMSHMPCIYQDFDDNTQEFAYGVSTNAIARRSELDLSKINAAIPNFGPELDLSHLGIQGFLLEPAEKFIAEKHWSETPFDGPDDRFRIIITCSSDHERKELQKLLEIPAERINSINTKCWSVRWPIES